MGMITKPVVTTRPATDHDRQLVLALTAMTHRGALGWCVYSGHVLHSLSDAVKIIVDRDGRWMRVFRPPPYDDSEITATFPPGDADMARLVEAAMDGHLKFDQLRTLVEGWFEAD